MPAKVSGTNTGLLAQVKIALPAAVGSVGMFVGVIILHGKLVAVFKGCAQM